MYRNDVEYEYSVMSDIFDTYTEANEGLKAEFSGMAHAARVNRRGATGLKGLARGVIGATAKYQLGSGSAYAKAKANYVPDTPAKKDGYSAYNSYQKGQGAGVARKVVAAIAYIFRKLIAFLKKVAARFVNFFKWVHQKLHKGDATLKSMNAATDFRYEVERRNTTAIKSLGTCISDTKASAMKLIQISKYLNAKTQNGETPDAEISEALDPISEKLDSINDRIEEILDYAKQTAANNIAKYGAANGNLAIKRGQIGAERVRGGVVPRADSVPKIVMDKAIQQYGAGIDKWFEKMASDLQQLEKEVETRGNSDVANKFSQQYSKAISILNKFVQNSSAANSQQS